MLDKTVRKIIVSALLEDIGKGDITTEALTSPRQSSEARIVAKQDGVLCGLEIARAVFQHLDARLHFNSSLKDGQKFPSQTVIARLKGKTSAILTGERVALNFLSYLSGIATKTNLFVQCVKPCKVKILDTRKTTPGLRSFERLAVRTGGGENHRGRLDEMYLIKDNHRVVCGNNLLASIERIKKTSKSLIEVEVDDLEQYKSVLKVRPDIILLDNMSVKQMKTAVDIKRREKAKTLLEASGGITLKNVHRIAQTGVDRISIGALTHTRNPIDFSLELLSS